MMEATMRLTDDELRDVLERAEEIQRTSRGDVVSISGDDLRVRFLRGSEHTVTADQVRPCSFVPGQRVMCEWSS
jgi:hypothetical protein